MIEPQSEQAGASSCPWKLILIALDSIVVGFAGVTGAAGAASTSTIGSRRTMPIASCCVPQEAIGIVRSEEHTSELQSLRHLVCRLLLEKKKKKTSLHTDARPRPHITEHP